MGQYQINFRVLRLFAVLCTLAGCSNALDGVESAAKAISNCLAHQTRANECNGDKKKALEKAILIAEKEGMSEGQIGAAKKLGLEMQKVSGDKSPYEHLLSRWGELDQVELAVRSRIAASAQPGIAYAQETYAALDRGERRGDSLVKALTEACVDSDIRKTRICNLTLKFAESSEEKLVEMPKELEAIRADYIARKSK